MASVGHMEDTGTDIGGDSTRLRGLDECRGSECSEPLTSLGRREAAHCAGRAIALVQLY
jgi:hypothetical protein